MDDPRFLRLHVRMSPAEKAAIEAEALRRGCSVSELVRRALPSEPDGLFRGEAAGSVPSTSRIA